MYMTHHDDKTSCVPGSSAMYFALLLVETPKHSGRILAFIISNRYLLMYTELQQDHIFI